MYRLACRLNRQKISLNLIARIRQRQTPWARRVLGLFIVVWLNMALQSCAMAFAGSYQDSVEHCPPGTHAEFNIPGDHDLQGDTTLDEPCNFTGAHCAFLDDYNYDHDGRTIQVKVKHAPSDVPLGIASPIMTSPVLSGWLKANGAADPRRGPCIQPSSNLLYCVYQI